MVTIQYSTSEARLATCRETKARDDEEIHKKTNDEGEGHKKEGGERERGERWGDRGKHWLGNREIKFINLTHNPRVVGSNPSPVLMSFGKT